MKNAVQKWGNSLGLRIPASIADEMRIKRGTAVTLQVADGVLSVRVARPSRRRRTKYNLKEMISRITPENLQPTYDWGADVGQEVL